jgi:hypothetical protein
MVFLFVFRKNYYDNWAKFSIKLIGLVGA